MYRLGSEIFFYNVTEMLKVMGLSSLSFEMGNGITLGYNCCHILEMLLTAFIPTTFSVQGETGANSS